MCMLSSCSKGLGWISTAGGSGTVVFYQESEAGEFQVTVMVSGTTTRIVYPPRGGK